MSEQRRDTLYNLNLYEECQCVLEETAQGQRECVFLWKHPVLCMLHLYRLTSSDRDKRTLLTCAHTHPIAFTYMFPAQDPS